MRVTIVADFFFQSALYAHTTKLFFQLRLTTYLLHTQQGRRKVWGGSSSIVLGIICLPPFQVGLGLTDLTKSGGEGEESPLGSYGPAQNSDGQSSIVGGFQTFFYSLDNKDWDCKVNRFRFSLPILESLVKSNSPNHNSKIHNLFVDVKGRFFQKVMAKFPTWTKNCTWTHH